MRHNNYAVIKFNLIKSKGRDSLGLGLLLRVRVFADVC